MHAGQEGHIEEYFYQLLSKVDFDGDVFAIEEDECNDEEPFTLQLKIFCMMDSIKSVMVMTMTNMAMDISLNHT